MEEDLFAVDFLFDGRIVRAEATFTSREGILVGTRLLQQYRLEINFLRGTVILEQLD